MADVSKININNTTYSVKDAEARTSISNLQTDFDELFVGPKRYFEVDSDGNLYYCYDEEA